MVRSGFLAAVLAVACCAASVSAQDDAAPPDPHNARPVPERVVPMPFPPAGGPLEVARSIELHSPDRMSERDRLLEADAESSIAERAGYNDIAFNQGKWGYEQLVCPALPNHLFLRFTRNNGAGDVSVFSASIPRNGEGHIRIIPIQRRSYSLFSPAPINALTIGAFNRIRIEDKPDSTPGWLGTALCYAALAGANPAAAQLNEPQLNEPSAASAALKQYPAASSPILAIPADGGAVIRFTDLSAKPRPMAWSLTFNTKGKLLKATHGSAGLVTEKPLPVSTAEQTAKPVPQFQ